MEGIRLQEARKKAYALHYDGTAKMAAELSLWLDADGFRIDIRVTPTGKD